MYSFRNLSLPLLTFIFISAAMQSCSWFSGNKTESDADSATVIEDFHADHDIAMSVRSIMDAINVGQPLDSADYNFVGILTDGNGTPLYTDVQGTPGQWEVKVMSDKSAVISNLYLGDLLPDELIQYLLENLDIDNEPNIMAEDFKQGKFDNLAIYTKDNTDLLIEQQMASTPNGNEGPLLKIILRRTELSSN